MFAMVARLLQISMNYILYSCYKFHNTVLHYAHAPGRKHGLTNTPNVSCCR